MGRHLENQTQLRGSESNTLPGDSRQRVKQFMQNLQDKICQALEQLDKKEGFREDHWERAEGGQGRTRVIREVFFLCACIVHFLFFMVASSFYLFHLFLFGFPFL